MIKVFKISYEKLQWIGCLGCLDIIKWQCKNYQLAWREPCQGKERYQQVHLKLLLTIAFVFGINSF
jgi:hypothetical protein